MLSLTRDSPAAALMHVSSATPNKRSLGALNGLARTVAAIQGAIGPGVADSLFAFPITNNILGGTFVYVVLLTLMCVELCVAVKQQQVERNTCWYDVGVTSTKRCQCRLCDTL